MIGEQPAQAAPRSTKEPLPVPETAGGRSVEGRSVERGSAGKEGEPAAVGAGKTGEGAPAGKGMEAGDDGFREEVFGEEGKGVESASDGFTEGLLGKEGKAGGESKRIILSDTHIKHYADLVNSNQLWSWEENIVDGMDLTLSQKATIKKEAISRGLIPDVKIKPGTRYPDFKEAGIVKDTLQLPDDIWLKRDSVQFKWLDSQLPNGRPDGYTWHHSEISGKMELVPFGIHNIIFHNGGRSPGNWANVPKGMR